MSVVIFLLGLLLLGGVFVAGLVVGRRMEVEDSKAFDEGRKAGWGERSAEVKQLRASIAWLMVGNVARKHGAGVDEFGNWAKVGVYPVGPLSTGEPLFRLTCQGGEVDRAAQIVRDVGGVLVSRDQARGSLAGGVRLMSEFAKQAKTQHFDEFFFVPKPDSTLSDALGTQ